MRARPPAVAGSFYPADPDRLAATVDDLLARASPRADHPRAIIAPHAGYVYSGPVAASAFATLAREAYRRVVILGPAHFVPVRGIAAPSVGAFATPLGDVPIDTEARDAAGVRIDDAPHAPEHSLEVQLPFLQRALDPVPILPLAVGDASPGETADALDRVWDEETLVVCSSDLSHYLDHDAAAARDRRTAEAICARDVAAIGPDDACGAAAIRGLLEAVVRHDLSVQLLDLRTSGDTAGDRARVVGYGAFALS